MQSFFTDTFGVSDEIFSFVVLPLLIFFARIADVSINTIRIIYVLGGRKLTATVLGFFESLIWLMAIGQIFEHIDNWICYVAYPGGFATGILVGMIIEEKIAYGKVIIRVISGKDIQKFVTYLQAEQFRYSVIQAIGREGEEDVIFTVIERERLEEVMDTLKHTLPNAFYTVEKVNRASEEIVLNESPQQSPHSWLRSVRRK